MRMDVWYRARSSPRSQIGYTYDGVYQQTSRFGYNGNGTVITGDKDSATSNALEDAACLCCGLRTSACLDWAHGRSACAVHRREPQAATFGRWTPAKRKRQCAGLTITTVAGNGVPANLGDYGPANFASLQSPYDVAVGSDGTLYIADNGLRRVGTDDKIYPIHSLRELPDILTLMKTSRHYLPPTNKGVGLYDPSSVAVGPDGSLLRSRQGQLPHPPD